MDEHVDADLFTLDRSANYWNDLYEHPASLFEHLMVKRCDYAWRYVGRHFKPTERILDLGCGAGVLSEKLIRSGFTVTAADASEDMLGLCRKRLDPLPADACRLVHASCLSLPFDDGEFDLVVCLGLFGYFDEVSQALREIRRVLKPGGTLILSVRNAFTPRLFDLKQLAQMPLRLLRMAARRVAAAVADAGQPGPAPKTVSAAADPADDGFRIEIHQNPWRLIRGVVERGYTLTDFDGIGYGPLALGEKKLLPVEASIKASDFLDWLCHATRLIWLTRWAADVSFYVFRRGM